METTSTLAEGTMNTVTMNPTMRLEDYTDNAQTAVSQCFPTSYMTDKDEQCFVINDDSSADKRQLSELANLVAKVRANMQKATAELNKNNGEVEVII